MTEERGVELGLGAAAVVLRVVPALVPGDVAGSTRMDGQVTGLAATALERL